MLKAVTFDFWQTLAMDTVEGLRLARAGRVQGIQSMLAEADLRAEMPEVEAAYDAVGVGLERLWATHRDVGSRGQLRMLLEALGLEGKVPPGGRLMDALDRAYCLPILCNLPVANDGAADVLADLRGRGLELAVICNTGRTPGGMLRMVLDRLGLAPFLKVLTFSDEVGWRKPHREIFARTLDALGVAPEQASHVGDDVTTDVAGARAIGMRAVHLCHPRGVSLHSDGAEAIANLRELPPLLFPAG